MILGRFLTLIIRDVLILKVENLGSYSSIHLLSGRTDLACHDSYSLTCGVFVVLILFYLIKNGMSWISLLAFKMNTLQRRNAIRRPQQEHVREEQGQQGQEEERKDSLKAKLVYAWFTLFKPLLKKSFALISLVLWVGIVFPILLGFIVTVFILHPLSSPPDYIKPHLILNQWMFGALLLKMIVYLVTLGPENTTRRILLHVQQRGIHMNVFDFYRHLIFPLLSLLLSILCLPKAVALLFES